MKAAARSIASLLPAGTEIVAALGALDQLVGISHECDYPAAISSLPRLTWSPVDVGASSAAIDAQVHALRSSGNPVIATNGTALREAAPDLIITQDLCEVCAVIDGDVRTLIETIDPVPELIPLRGRTLDGIFSDITTIGAALDRRDAAADLIADARRRLAALGGVGSVRPPRVLCIEWLEPLYLAGHWVPELVAAAGGLDVGARPGDHSTVRQWTGIGALSPEIVIVMLCGFGLDRAHQEWDRFLDSPAGAVARTLTAPVRFIDGNAYTSRPGPRVIEGAERIADLLRT